ncbi:flagellar basal body P-ring formation chaperone FlgA [Sulfurimonas sp. SWIR-19]|uniref:flagellar basal body P-ring formation chaperone FlgA n=1 Tax=Sulfurimonas sp. SWIR-19 TaxID=2878390 RepID=UPI001CF5B176|nr:flagellar basal body P-ring formation chaperone FlgA [Sulfurimonas sp. SWIR-19]UCM99226.1 flagellar basal body P-ring formation chaperone FlgA [Sulfurimonas sp. SWIR-19]
MLFLKIILLLISFSTIFAANTLQSNYFIKNDFIMLSDIVSVNKENDKKLFNIDKNRYSKRIQKKELLKILHKNGFDNFTSKHSYIQFTKRSPIDTTFIKNSIKKHYTEKYKNIKISETTLFPTHYMEELPKHYTVHFSTKAHLSNKGILYIKTDDNKKIFFKYKILATVSILFARKNIKKDNELTNVNTQKKSIILDKFKAMPLQGLHVKHYQSKHNIKADDIITKRDVVGLFLVKRGSSVSVNYNNNAIHIYFSAKALQNGRLGDTVSVIKRNGKKIRVVITGKNKAEVQ